MELIVASEQGRILHGTKNIRDSGAPLEARFREFMGSRLPAPFRVIQGYLFDVESVCTPQIDALIINEGDAHELMKSNEGASYVPYPCARVLCEVKNSASGAEKHLKQVKNITSAVNSMERRTRENRSGSGGSIFHRPLSILLMANSNKMKISEFKNWVNSGNPLPNYTLFLDKGMILAHHNSVLSTDHLSFYDYNNLGVPTLFEPEGDPNLHRGLALMWLYFAIVAYLNWTTKGNQSPIIDFTKDIEHRFPLIKKEILATVSNL